MKRKILIELDTFNKIFEVGEKKTRLYYIFDILKSQLNVSDLTEQAARRKLIKYLEGADYVGLLLSDYLKKHRHKKDFKYAVAWALIEMKKFPSEKIKINFQKCAQKHGEFSINFVNHECIRQYGDNIENMLDSVIMEYIPILDILKEEFNIGYISAAKYLHKLSDDIINKPLFDLYNAVNRVYGLNVNDVEFISKAINMDDKKLIRYITKLMGYQTLDLVYLIELVKNGKEDRKNVVKYMIEKAPKELTPAEASIIYKSFEDLV